jgi:hypothetical protein
MKNLITWKVVDEVSDASYDSSSSLTEGAWGVFKHKSSNGVEADVAVALELVSAASFVKAGVNDADILGSAAGRMPITGNFLEAVVSRLSLASWVSSDTLSS